MNSFMEGKLNLKEWIKEFIKHKDVFLKTIVDIKDSNEGFNVKYKDKQVKFIVEKDLVVAIKKLDKKPISIATLNTLDNFDVLIQNWHKLVSFKDLTIFFINPDSMSERKWILRPHLHDKIADDDSLKTGLKSLFMSVDKI